MHVINFAPIALLATQAVAQLSVIQGVLSGIQTEVVAYSDAFTAEDADEILSQGDVLLAANTAGVDTVTAADGVSLIEALSLRTSIQALEAAVQTTYDNAIAHHADVEDLNIAEDVHADFVAQRDVVATLGAAVASKVPAAVRPLAQTYIDNIDAIISEAIDAYA